MVGTDADNLIDCSGYSLPGSKGVIVKAGAGDDFVIGSPRADHLSGGKDCDRVEGGAGNDVVDGGQGDDNDNCQVEAANGTFFDGGLFGDAGDDLVKGGKGDDDLFGDSGAGNIGGTADVCEGGPPGEVDNFEECEA